MKRLFSSNKASEKAVNLPFTVIVAILIVVVLIFAVIRPLILKPLGTDACLQQGGVRANSCDDASATTNPFVEVDDANLICCIAIPGKSAEFKRWAEVAGSATSGSDGPRQVVQDENAAATYNIRDSRMALFAPSGPGLSGQGLLVDDIYKTGKVFYPPQNNGKTLDLGDDPRQTFDLVGVNNLGDGSCMLAIREAAFYEQDGTYRPKSTGSGNLVSAEPGFDYQKADCKKGEGVQITGNLRGLVGNDSYYIATYAVKWTDETTQEERALQVHALIKAQLPDTDAASTAEDLTELNSDSDAPVDECTRCSAYVSNETCNTQIKTTICDGCWWTDTNACADCSIVGTCSRYDDKYSCQNNPCRAGTKCAWSGSECFDCGLTDSCEGYPDGKSCKADACEIGNCEAKGFLGSRRCVTASS